MSQVVQLDKPVFEVSHTFANGPLERQVSFPGSNGVFIIHASRQQNYNNPFFHLIVKVTPEDNTTRYKANVVVVYNDTDSDTLNQNKPMSKHLLVTGDWEFTSPVTLKLTFEIEQPLPLVDKQSFQCPISGDVKSYIEDGPVVTLVGSDGSTKVSKRLLKIRSTALRNMLTHDTKEKQTMTVELKDFDCKTLDAFGHFLMTGKIKNGKDTALGLVILGDKYDIQIMKQVSERFVLNHITEMNLDDVLDVFCKLSRDLMKKLAFGAK